MDQTDESSADAMAGRALLRLPFGLLIGFVGVFVTLQAIDRFESDAPAEPLEVILGVPDFAGFCSREGQEQLQGVATTGDAFGWRCVGLVDRLWTSEGLSVDEVCRWEYGPSAFARLIDETDSDGWLCASEP